MKKLLVLLLIFFAIPNLKAQSFEGKITSQNAIKSKLTNITDAQFSSMMGTRQEYFIKGGNYKSVTNGTMSPWQLYINKGNKLYNKMTSVETIYWIDATSNDDSVLEFKLEKGAMNILGYTCDRLVLTCKSGTQQYFFDSKLAVDPKLYQNHKYGNWYEYLKLAKAVPLKIIIDTAQFTLESIAIEVKAMKLDEREFQLPENAKTMKSPY